MRQGTKREDCNTKAANDLATLHGNAEGLKLAEAGVHLRNRKEPHHLRASAADQPAWLDYVHSWYSIFIL